MTTNLKKQGTKKMNSKYSTPEWKSLSYDDKLKSWLQDCNGKMPTYDSLIENLIVGIKSSDNRIDGGDHTIEFPVPAVFYDHELPSYRPDYEYETFMFNRLLGELDNDDLLHISTETQILGTGQDTSNWRPYIVTKVEFSIVDGGKLLEAIGGYKEAIADSVIANLAKKVL